MTNQAKGTGEQGRQIAADELRAKFVDKKKDFIEAAGDFYRDVALRPESISNLYAGDTLAFAKPLAEKGDARLGEIAKFFSDVSRIAIRHPDAEKAVNRLLSLTSIKRIEEEMDAEKYKSATTKALASVAREFGELADLFAKEKKLIEPAGSVPIAAAATALLQMQNGLREEGASFQPVNENDVQSIARFAVNYDRFLDTERKLVDQLRGEFASTRLIDTYNAVLQKPALTVERQNLLNASIPAVVAALAVSALHTAVAIHDAVTINTSLLTMSALVFVVVYLASYVIGRRYRDKQVSSVAVVVKDYLHGMFSSDRSPTSVFSFHSNDFTKAQAKRADADNVAKLILDNALGWERRSTVVMIVANVAVVGISVAAALFAAQRSADWLEVRQWPRTQDLAFTVQRPESGGHAVFIGRLRNSTPDRYWLTPVGNTCRGDAPVIELARQAVVTVLPATLEDLGRTSSCGAPFLVQTVTASRLDFSSGLQVKQEDAALAGAVQTLADRIQAGMADIARRIVQPAPQAQACAGTACSAAAADTRASAGPDITHEALQRRYIILPLFPGPVRAMTGTYGTNGINRPEEAFHFGQADPASHPSLPERHKFERGIRKWLISHIANGIRACLLATKQAYGDLAMVPDSRKLRLSVAGFASESEFTSIPASNQTLRNEMNLFLAEGRRVGIIRSLTEAIGVEGMVVFEKAPTRLVFPSVGDVRREEVTRGFHFDTHSEMRAALSAWAMEPPGSPDLLRSEREAFARSVVVGIENDALNQCGRV